MAVAQPVAIISTEPVSKRSKQPLHSMHSQNGILHFSRIIKIECAKVHVLCDVLCAPLRFSFLIPKIYNDDAVAGNCEIFNITLQSKATRRRKKPKSKKKNEFLFADYYKMRI